MRNNEKSGAGSNGAQFTPESVKRMMEELKAGRLEQTNGICEVVRDESVSVKEHVTAEVTTFRGLVEQKFGEMQGNLVDATTLGLNKTVEEAEKTRKFAGEGFADLKDRLNGGLSLGKAGLSALIGVVSGWWGYGVFSRGLETADPKLLLIYSVLFGGAIFSLTCIGFSFLPPFVRKVKAEERKRPAVAEPRPQTTQSGQQEQQNPAPAGTVDAAAATE